MLIACIVVQLVLRIQLATLQPHNGGSVNPRLPGRLAKVFDGTRLRVVKDVLNFLKGLVGCLREAEEHVPEHGETEDGEEQVSLPSDVGERRWDKVRKSEIESPVSGSGQGDCLASDTQRVKLRRIRPRDGTPGWRVRGHEEICASDDSLGRGARNGHGLGVRGELAWGRRTRVDSKEAGIAAHPKAHEESTDQKWETSTPVVEPDQCWDSHAYIDDVVDTRRQQSGAANAGHVEDVDNIVHCSRISVLFQCESRTKFEMLGCILMTFMPVSCDQIWVKRPIMVRLIM